MQKNNLVELYTILKDKLIVDGEIPGETIERIRRLSNKDVQTIKNSPHQYEMFLLLSSEYYNYCSDELKNQLIDILNRTIEKEQTNCIVDLSDLLQYADDCDYNENPNDFPELISLIIDNIKLEYIKGTTDLVIYLMMNHGMSASDIKEIVKILANAKRQNQISKAINYMKRCRPRFMRCDKGYEIIKSIVNAKGLIQATYASRVAKNKMFKVSWDEPDYEDVARINKLVSLVASEPHPKKAIAIGAFLTIKNTPYSDEQEYEYASIIKNAKWYRQAEATSRILRTEKIMHLNWPDEVMRELITIVSKAKFDYQSDIISDALMYEFTFGKTLSRDFITLKPTDIVRFASILSSSKGLEQLRTVTQLLDINDVIRSKDFLVITDIISSAQTKSKAEYALDVASNPIILNSNSLVEITERASKCGEGTQVEIAENLLLSIIETAKNRPVLAEVPNIEQQIEKLFSLLSVNGDFWEVLEFNPEEAMHLLNSQVEDPTLNIPNNFKVRLRKLTREDY